MANLNYKHFTLGVEEEYMVIDPVSKELKSHEQKIVHEGQKMIKDKVKAEMHLYPTGGEDVQVEAY